MKYIAIVFVYQWQCISQQFSRGLFYLDIFSILYLSCFGADVRQPAGMFLDLIFTIFCALHLTAAGKV